MDLVGKPKVTTQSPPSCALSLRTSLHMLTKLSSNWPKESFRQAISKLTCSFETSPPRHWAKRPNLLGSVFPWSHLQQSKLNIFCDLLPLLMIRLTFACLMPHICFQCLVVVRKDFCLDIRLIFTYIEDKELQSNFFRRLEVCKLILLLAYFALI